MTWAVKPSYLEGISLTVSGDPESCVATVKELRELKRTTEDSAELLRRHQDVLPHTFTGIAGIAYRDRAARIAVAALAFAARCSKLAHKLVDFIAVLERAKATLDQARFEAIGAGLYRAGDDALIPPPLTLADITVWETWVRLYEDVAGAHTMLQGAQEEWEGMLARWTQPFGSLDAPPSWQLPEWAPKDHTLNTGREETAGSGKKGEEGSGNGASKQGGEKDKEKKNDGGGNGGGGKKDNDGGGDKKGKDDGGKNGGKKGDKN